MPAFHHGDVRSGTVSVLLPCLAAALIVAACASHGGSSHTGTPGSSLPGGGLAHAGGGKAAGRARHRAERCPISVAPAFSCSMRRRIAYARTYLKGAPGIIGLVLHDRRTGATWRNAHAGEELPAASTVKLAMATDLLWRNRSGRILLTSGDRDLIADMLYDSDDGAADVLWSRYFNVSFIKRAAAYGMPGATFTVDPPYWGYMYCTADDLVGLMNHILSKLPPDLRSYLVTRLRRVAPNQRFGVWGAGGSNYPGNKDGWEHDSGIWVVDSVGFAGPGARYTLAMMYDLNDGGSFRRGANTLTRLAALLLGRQTASPACGCRE